MKVTSPAYRQAPTSRAITLPAPAGVNLVDSPAALQPGECLVMNNLIRAEYGARVRSGWYSYARVADLLNPVRTLFGFEGSTSDKDRLFATTRWGIYNVTYRNMSPVPTASPYSDTPLTGDTTVANVAPLDAVQADLASAALSFSDANGYAGYGVSRGFTTLDGEHYLYYADEVNGLHIYKESTGTWTKPTSASTPGNFYGTDPATFCFVTAWKKRVWFVKKNSTLAYYLPVNSYAGQLETFDFGPQFKHGGHLVGIWSWTLDAGEGVDDMLVAISSSGDVVIYQGTDPDYFPEIRLRGVWYVGSVPAGRRIATEHGGDLLILSSLGMVPLSKIVNGASLSQPGLYVTHKIAPAFSALMETYRDTWGWATAIHPRDNILIVLTPFVLGGGYQQWAMSLSTGAWSHLDLPMTCAEGWHGDLYFGQGGVVCVNKGTTDGFTLLPPVVKVLYGFQSGGTAAVKHLLMARPHFMNGATPKYLVWGRVDFDMSDIPGAYYFLAGEVDAAPAQWRGLVGMGTYVSVAFKMEDTTGTTMSGMDVLYDEGGVL